VFGETLLDKRLLLDWGISKHGGMYQLHPSNMGIGGMALGFDDIGNCMLESNCVSIWRW
jgi:hypothetical protein